MANISSPGIGSGLSVDTIVTQMMALEKRPLELLQSKASGIQTKISSFGQIKSAVSALYDASKALTDLDTWRGKTLTSSDESILKGSVTSTATAASFSIKVDNLAKAQSVASGSTPTGSAIGTDGTLTLQIGQWSNDGTSFTSSSTAAVNISISASDSMSTIADKINRANAGVSAVVVKGVSGDQLLMRSSKTGEENGFSITASAGLGQLAYDPASIAANSGSTQTQAAEDARFTINGISSRSASNTATDIVPGVTLNLTKTSATPVEVTIADDSKLVKDKLEAFMQAYNKVNSVIASLTKYDAATETSQPLQGDSTAVNLQNSLRRMIGTPNDAGTYLSDLGLQLQRDGSLSINSTKLDAALKDLPTLQESLTHSSGIATRIRDFTFQANATEGTITNRNTALQNALKGNLSDQDRMSLLLEQRQTTLLKQYQSLDASMGSMSSLSSYVTQWTSGLNK